MGHADERTRPDAFHSRNVARWRAPVEQIVVCIRSSFRAQPPERLLHSCRTPASRRWSTLVAREQRSPYAFRTGPRGHPRPRLTRPRRTSARSRRRAHQLDEAPENLLERGGARPPTLRRPKVRHVPSPTTGIFSPLDGMGRSSGAEHRSARRWPPRPPPSDGATRGV